MNVLIIEDEEKLARQLKNLLYEVDQEIKVLSTVASVQSAIRFISQTDQIDLILVDIYLNDGLSFEIFKQVNCKFPVIFSTAYDQYALKAFELDSVDYLLKPIKLNDLKKAIEKYKRIFSYNNGEIDIPTLTNNIQNLYERFHIERNFQKNFLLPYKDRLVPVGIAEIAYFQAEYGMVKCVTIDQRLFAIDQSLDALYEKLNPSLFFRVNRQFIVKREVIVDIEYYFNGRLFLNILPKPQETIVISKAKANEFKQWINNE